MYDKIKCSKKIDEFYFAKGSKMIMIEQK